MTASHFPNGIDVKVGDATAALTIDGVDLTATAAKLNAAVTQSVYPGAAVATTTPALTSYGFTLAQATALVAMVNSLRAAAIANGSMAAS